MTEEISRRRFLLMGGALLGTAALGGAGYAATWAPEFEQRSTTMGEGMSTVLVVYGTGTGCTEGVARRIGETVAKRGARVDVVPAKDAPDPSAYDAVIVGSGVRAGSWHAPVKEWVIQNADALRAGSVAFYTVCLTLATDPGKTGEVRAYTDALVAESGVTPAEFGLFAGSNEPKQYSFVERTILKLMKAPEGDFRDWDAIDAWADATAVEIGAVS